MAELIITSILIFPGSADTHIFYLNDSDEDQLLSYSGFLNSIDGAIQYFQPEEMIMYHGSQSSKISRNLKKRVKTDPSNEQQSIRQIKVQVDEQRMLIAWTLDSTTLRSLD